MVKIFEKGKVPSGYTLMQSNLPEEAGLRGIRITDGELQIITRKFPNMMQIMQAGQNADKAFNVSLSSEDEVRQYLTAGAELIGAQGLEIIILVQGSNLPCLKGEMDCNAHSYSKLFIMCKEQAVPNCWYGLARPYVKVE